MWLCSHKPVSVAVEPLDRLCPAPRYAHLFVGSIGELRDCHADEVPLVA
jgi:hypothetical protein